MTDDIVTQLRTEGKRVAYCDIWNVLDEAVNEIERLRNDVKVRDLQILANFRAMDAMHKELYGDAD